MLSVFHHVENFTQPQPFNIHNFCTSVFLEVGRDPHQQRHAPPIERICHYKEKLGVEHEFVIATVRCGERRYYLRLERQQTPPMALSFFKRLGILLSSMSNADDRVYVAASEELVTAGMNRGPSELIQFLDAPESTDFTLRELCLMLSLFPAFSPAYKLRNEQCFWFSMVFMSMAQVAYDTAAVTLAGRFRSAGKYRFLMFERSEKSRRLFVDVYQAVSFPDRFHPNETGTLTQSIVQLLADIIRLPIAEVQWQAVSSLVVYAKRSPAYLDALKNSVIIPRLLGLLATGKQDVQAVVNMALERLYEDLVVDSLDGSARLVPLLTNLLSSPDRETVEYSAKALAFLMSSDLSLESSTTRLQVIPRLFHLFDTAPPEALMLLRTTTDEGTSIPHLAFIIPPARNPLSSLLNAPSAGRLPDVEPSYYVLATEVLNSALIPRLLRLTSSAKVGENTLVVLSRIFRASTDAINIAIINRAIPILVECMLPPRTTRSKSARRQPNPAIQSNAVLCLTLLVRAHDGTTHPDVVNEIAGAVPSLVSLLALPDEDVKLNCIAALSQITERFDNCRELVRQRDAISILVATHKSDNEQIQAGASIFLARLMEGSNEVVDTVRQAEASETLATLVKSSCDDVSAAAALSLSYLIEGLETPLVENAAGATTIDPSQSTQVDTILDRSSANEIPPSNAQSAGSTNHLRTLVARLSSPSLETKSNSAVLLGYFLRRQDVQLDASLQAEACTRFVELIAGNYQDLWANVVWAILPLSSSPMLPDLVDSHPTLIQTLLLILRIYSDEVAIISITILKDLVKGSRSAMPRRITEGGVLEAMNTRVVRRSDGVLQAAKELLALLRVDEAQTRPVS